jgi:hypothetical protein
MISPQTADEDLYENMILNKSMIFHLYNYAKENVLKSFEMNSTIQYM